MIRIDLKSRHYTIRFYPNLKSSRSCSRYKGR